MEKAVGQGRKQEPNETKPVNQRSCTPHEDCGLLRRFWYRYEEPLGGGKQKAESVHMIFSFERKMHIHTYRFLYISTHLAFINLHAIRIYAYMQVHGCVISCAISVANWLVRKERKECLPVCYQLPHPRRINCKLTFPVGLTFSEKMRWR